MNWKDTLQKKISKGRKGSSFLHAVKKLLTNEWVSQEELHSKSLDLKSKRGRPYRDRLGKSQLVNSLVKLGFAEVKKGRTSRDKLIRRKQ